MSDTTAAAIRVNGRDEPLSAATIATLLESKDISPQMRGVAVARNGAVVPRAEWPTTALCPGDMIEIVLARQGG
jgi:sulfur carrier protein